MSIQSLSFWQQDANYWNQSVTRDQSLANSDALITAMGTAMTNEATGLASIANQEALTRVNTELTAAVQSALQSSSGSSTSSSSGTSSSASSSNSTASSANSTGSSSSSSGIYGPPISFSTPASGTGTVPLTASTALLTLGIPEKGTITVGAGSNATTYTSTGTDTVGDLIKALNANASGNANVTAYLNSAGDLVITSNDNMDAVSVGGTYASAIGFGTGNEVFQPSVASAGSSASSASSASSSSSSSSSSSAAAASSSSGTSGSTGSTGSSTGTSTSSGIPLNSAYALQTGSTAELLLASNGLAGTLVNVLA